MTENVHLVQPAACRGDGICVEICPEGLLEIVDGIAATVHTRADACICCGQCVAVCPNEALTMPQMQVEEFNDLPGSQMSYTEFLALLKSRRSVRVFNKVPVEDEKNDQLLAAHCPMQRMPTSCVLTPCWLLSPSDSVAPSLVLSLLSWTGPKPCGNDMESRKRTRLSLRLLSGIRSTGSEKASRESWPVYDGCSVRAGQAHGT